MRQGTDWEKLEKGREKEGYQKEKRKEEKEGNSDRELFLPLIQNLSTALPLP